MLTLIIIMGILFIVLVGFFAVIWHRTDWDKLDRANQKFVNEEGDHVYYDRHLIDHKRSAKHGADSGDAPEA